MFKMNSGNMVLNPLFKKYKKFSIQSLSCKVLIIPTKSLRKNILNYLNTNF